MLDEKPDLPCLIGGRGILQQVRQRFRLDLDDGEADIYMRDLIAAALASWRTTTYDYFQLLTQGIKV
jgi:phosphatidylinositol kinase/protein kinase (PI-3  family)